jgi:hypothetical protein
MLQVLLQTLQINSLSVRYPRALWQVLIRQTPPFLFSPSSVVWSFNSLARQCDKKIEERGKVTERKGE